ncbi:xanthine phosphoribosyltransferase [Thermincola ferriacetica]|uniref:Xanthine phosphoribosyltransferase n=2 Tax=Thermincola TaxID=278993 RepID=D5XD95_THEPJ|nr:MULTISPECIES: xanthine phosphoribosyltransferase [Thermincola]ADG81743.1 xanthine phosphoribosyltransferase [Thermincola potens JR]KNZ68529.1 xanthine phosphoribosyltransferase [Thermincola ferriacetica]
MELLKQKIREHGIVVSDTVLKVDSFLNHQLDPELILEIGKEIANRFKNDGVTKVLTIEASGIAVALAAAMELKVPVVFAKKNKPSTLQGQIYSALVHSFTKNEDVTISVSANYLKPSDRVLIIDDFLAMGAASKGLVEIVRQSKARLVGIGIVIEKGFQSGGQELRNQGIRVESLVTVKSLASGQIEFC